MSKSPSSNGSTAGFIHNLPRARNLYFTGRSQILDAIAKSRTGDHTVGPVLAVYGAGGIGKTELALEYAYEHQSSYGLIWWLPADEPSTLAWHYAKLADRLGIRIGLSADAGEARRAVQEALSQRSDWLLIFDNVPNAAAVREYLPRGTGHVLMTSRDSHWHGVAKSFCLRVLDPSEASEFIARRSGWAADPNASTLAHALGNLPIALEQAAAMIRETGLSCTDYLRRFEGYWAELLQSGRSTGDYPDALAMTWELACREVEETNLEALALLKLLVYLAPAEVPQSLLLKAAGALPAPLSSTLSTSVGLGRLIDVLQRFALLNASDEAIFVHHFVGAITRDRLAADQQNTWRNAALEMMQISFGFDPHARSTWADAARAMPHALAVVEHSEAGGLELGTCSKILNMIGEFLQQVGQYEQARVVLEHALALCDRAYGPENPRRSAIANNLGRALKRLGNLTEARAYFEDALGLDEAVYGASHPHVAEVVNNYGTVLYETGDVDTALRQFEFALEICRAHYGANHPKVATVTNNVAYARAYNGDLDSALDYFTQALSNAEAACGADHPLVASIRTNLGITLRLKGQTDAARAQFERATAISQQTLGDNHSEMARGFGHLGAVYLEGGEYAKAHSYLKRALEIDEQATGPSNVALVGRLNDLGKCLKAMGDLDASTACYQRAAGILRDSRATQKLSSGTGDGQSDRMELQML